MSTIRITASVALAINYDFTVTAGNFECPKKKGEVLPPEWKFRFFTEIRASGIQVFKRFKPDTEIKPFQGVGQVLEEELNTSARWSFVFGQPYRHY